MREHVRVLQARRHPGAVRGCRLRRERVRHGDEEEREERRYRAKDRDDPDDEVARPAAVQPYRSGAEAREDEQPEEKRPSCPPQNAEIVYAVGRASLVVLRDVGEREVVPEESREQHARRDDRREERRDQGVLRREREPPPAERALRWPATSA